MDIQLPRIQLAHDVASNTRATTRWFKVIAWSLEQHPQGLFVWELRQEYQRLCELQGTEDPHTDDGDFHGSLSRHLQICLAICQQLGWATYRLERREWPLLPQRPGGPPRPPSIPEPKWGLTRRGKQAHGWSERRLARRIALHLLRTGITPWINSLRFPLALASTAIGIVKLVTNWGVVQTMLEGIIAVAGGLLLAVIHPTYAASAVREFGPKP